MQCILYKIYFFESFSYELQFDMHFYMHSYLHKSFYSCKKWVLQAQRLIKSVCRGWMGIPRRSSQFPSAEVEGAWVGS
jgi:hypothetical protein